VNRLPPLGGYREFVGSSGGPFSWGEGGRSSVTYGEDVIPHLVAGLREISVLASSGMPRKAAATGAVLGCVYRLTSSKVVDALIPLQTCVIVDRQQSKRSQLERLNKSGSPMTSLGLPGLDEVALPLEGGGAPLVGPHSPMPRPVDLGPVRAAGWLFGGAKSLPLVHVKMLVAGRSWVWEDDFGAEQGHFTPLRTWMGSANWTEFAPMHLEFGLWSDDPSLLEHNQRFLLNAVRFSQPLDSTTVGPAPELVDCEYDDAAFAEYLAELGPEEPIGHDSI